MGNRKVGLHVAEAIQRKDDRPGFYPRQSGLGQGMGSMLDRRFKIYAFINFYRAYEK